MIASMTGFARDAGSSGTVTWAWECKSVNGRNLDVRVRVPPGFDAIGEEARKIVSARTTRGSIQVGLTIQKTEARRGAVRINAEVLSSLVASLKALPSDIGLQSATLDGLLQVRGVVEVDDQDEADLSISLHAELAASAKTAAEAFATARLREGTALGTLLGDQLSAMRALVGAFERHPSRSVEAIRVRLQNQVSALLSGQHGLDVARLHQEAALLATRADVREELDRLGAHIEASAELLTQGGAIGRKLDFLAQEFGREASTLCAKANDVELSRIGLDLRALVDQFREQAQNVE